MPTIQVKRDELYQSLGQTMTDAEFDHLCFEFGIELDEVTSERQQVAKEQGAEKASELSDEVLYRIDIPANRYDLLSMEGLVRALSAYLYNRSIPSYTCESAKECVTVTEATLTVRPFIACAVLRGFKMTPALYDSLIELQDKIHSGLGRKRTIVSIGTYDLDTIKGPFSFDAVDPKKIQFVPLNQTESVDGHGLVKKLESDLKLRKFLPIIRDAPKYPVLWDSEKTVLSLPPLINGDSSKITLKTKNIFIDVTGVDANKVNMALNILVTSFADCCSSIESVELKLPSGQSINTPDLACRDMSVSVEYINKSLGLSLSATQICSLLTKMMLKGIPVADGMISVNVTPVRSDIIHACDVMEDVAIAYGFNNLPLRLPPTSCIGSSLPLNSLSDKLRREVAMAGWTEILTFSLCSHKENFDDILVKDPGDVAVVLSNPKTVEFEVVHTSLIPSMMKTIASNKKHALPLKLFQVGDVVFQDASTDTGSRNERRLCASFCGMSSGLEIIHGLLDRIMLMLGVKPCSASDDNVPEGSYYIKASNIPTFFPGRQAEVFVDGKLIGSFGIIHPEVSANFDASYVTSLLEINIEHFL